MKRSILGILLGLSLSAVGVLIVGQRIDEPPKIVAVWPIVAYIVTVVIVWFVQGAIMALLARGSLRRAGAAHSFSSRRNHNSSTSTPPARVAGSARIAPSTPKAAPKAATEATTTAG